MRKAQRRGEEGGGGFPRARVGIGGGVFPLEKADVRATTISNFYFYFLFL